MAHEEQERPECIETARLLLVVLLPGEIRSLIAGDTHGASASAGVVFPAEWPETKEAREGLPLHLGHLESDERERAWRIRVVADSATGAVVGSVNLKGPPDADGDVEIGWGISSSHRRRGYAREAATAVMDWAIRQPGVRSVSATIADDNVASQALAAKLGMARTARIRRNLPVWILL